MNAGWNVCLPISLTPEEFATVVAAAHALGVPADEFVKGATLREVRLPHAARRERSTAATAQRTVVQRTEAAPFPLATAWPPE
jgi:hypothetical protein